MDNYNLLIGENQQLAGVTNFIGLTAELVIYLAWGGSVCFYLLNHGILLTVPVNILESWISIFIVGAIQFARSEGLIAAPEPTHAIAATIREALHCRETGESKVILMAMCGHGHFDLTSYEKYLQGNMVDLSYSDEKVQAALSTIPQVSF